MPKSRRLATVGLLALFTAAGLMAAAGSGCSRTKRPFDVTADPYPPSQVQIADRDLAGKLRFQPPIIQRDESGLLFVTVPVRAATSRPQIVQYRFTFLDDNGAPLPGGEYQTVTLESNTFSRLQGNSTTPRAADFQVEIRAAR